MTREELISALESAECGSRELDVAIWETLENEGRPAWIHIDPEGREFLIYDGSHGKEIYAPLTKVPHYTTNLQATLSLVPEGYSWLLDSSGLATVFDPPGTRASEARAATPQLALASACIKAMERDDG